MQNALFFNYPLKTLRRIGQPYNGMNTKEFKAVIKSAKVDLQKEVTSVSFWINTISKAAQSGECRKAVIHVLGVERLPKSDELKRALLTRCLAGFKFCSEEGSILVVRKEFEKDSSGKIVRVGDKPVVKTSWYERKDKFSFIAVWQAIFIPSKTRVIIPAEDIR